VRVCDSCGRGSEGAFAFCPFCGARLETVAGATGRELRKTVTVLFCDVEGSTSLGETVDPEAVRELLARYFERLSRIIEAHGGTVEKFVGDAVMAVFGIPVLHEDDALRALRAAAEIQQALPQLGVRARIGVNTGEVVTGTQERLATGDAVNVAARLEQAAPAGGVLLGAATARLVRGAVELEAVPPLQLKGKSEPVAAYRLLTVGEPAPRRLDAKMVGRERELGELRDGFARVEQGSCRLVTVLGTAGIGKSKLVAEFLSGVDARVVLGRCLSYGEGITYWPVVEILKQLDAFPSEEAASAPLRSLLGESPAPTSADEIAWAFRKLLEETSRERPLVCVLDDLHWGEETLLDLVEHIAVLSRDAPILLLCMARPELLERRAGWGGGQSSTTTVVLEPLGEAESNELIDALGGVEGDLRARLVDAAEGNPLYLEEMVALVRDSEGHEVTVPPTIQALLGARLDQLDLAERTVLECAAVEGRVFHRSAVQALLDEGSQLSTCLVSLVRAELVQPEREQIPGDEAYRFRHLLIRDAAYDAMPKAVRAELHERYASWCEEQRSDLVELDELVGHHLAQAARFKDELGRRDPALSARAADRLSAAGRRALWRGDDRAAATLLARAVMLRRPGYDVALELDLASAQQVPERAAAIAEAAAEHAHAAADGPGEATARAVASFHRLLAGESGIDEVETRARDALSLLEASEDHRGLVHVWSALGYGVANARGRYGEFAHASEQALRHARLAGARPSHLYNLEVALVFGPTPADEALRILDAVIHEVSHPHPFLFRSHLLAMLGRFDEAWPSAEEAAARSRDLSPALDIGDYTLAEIAALAGNYQDAARRLGQFCAFLEEHGQRGLLSTFAPVLGRLLCTLGRWDEAEQQARLGRELGDEHDMATQSLWRLVQARVDSHGGRHVEAEALARQALALIEESDAINFQGAALADLAEILVDAGRAEDASAVFDQALERYERKANLAAAAQVRARSAALLEGTMPA
jgi:class 3 adenylate cyclase/tetratricopeptide (TPR) repeat protein